MDYAETCEIFGGEGLAADGTNYAVLGGTTSHGLVVIDYDDRERGAANPVDTFTVETAKGLHYYVRLPVGARVGNRSFPRTRLDLRGQGGIAIAPPSLHPTGAFYRVARDCPIREVTEDWLNSYLAVVLAKYGETNRGVGRIKPQGWFAETFIEQCPEGGRDNTLAQLAGFLLNSHLDHGDIKAILLVWAESKCDPPLDEADVDRVLGSLVRKQAWNDRVQTNTAQGVVATEVPRERGPEDSFYESL